MYKFFYYSLDQRDLIDIYTTFHPKTIEYSFFLSTHVFLYFKVFL